MGKKRAKTVFKYLFLAVSVAEMLFLCVESLLPGEKSSAQSGAVGEIVDTVVTEFGGEGIRDVPPVSVGISLNEEMEEVRLQVGQVWVPTLYYQPEETSANYRRAVWQSSNEDVLSFRGGKFYANQPGEAVVSVRLKYAEGIEASARVVVSEIAAEALELCFEDGSDAAELKQYASIRLVAKLDPEDATAPVKFSSGDEEIATVDETGLVHAVSVGSTYLEAAYTPFDAQLPALSARVEIQVIEGEPPLSPLSLSLVSPENIHKGNLFVGEDGTFSALPMSEIDPSDTLIYTSSDEKVLSVDPTSGRFEAKRKGEAIVTVFSAAYPDIFDCAELRILNEELDARIEAGSGYSLEEGELPDSFSMSVKAGSEVPLSVSAEPELFFVRYKSSDPTVAEVTDGGVILPYRASSKPIEITVEISDDPSFSNENGGLVQGFTLELTVQKQSFSSGVSGWQLFIRKLFGHFGAFILLGVLLGITAALFDNGSWKRRLVILLILTLVGFAFAGLTEILQMPIFTAGRGPSFRDVLIDFSGYLPAMLLFYGGYLLIRFLAERIKRRRNK